MYLDHHVLLRISGILDVLGEGALLMDDQGNVLHPQKDNRKLSLPEAVITNGFEPVVFGGVTLMGIMTSDSKDGTCPLYVCLPGDSVDVQKCVRICCELIRLIVDSGPDESDRSHAYRKLLRGESNVSETENIANEFAVPMRQNRCVVCIYIRRNHSEISDNVFEGCLTTEGDFWTDLTPNMIAVVKSMPDECGYEELKHTAEGIWNILQDAGINAVIGVSDPKMEIEELATAVKEAREVINIGGVYCPNESILIYRRLMLERFLYNIPASACSEYGMKVFNHATARLFTDEMLNTIEVFFKSNLNLSEAARMLGIHRNTLVYRLEKVEKLTGFDLREFDDAVTFKMAMLLNKNAQAVKPRI